MTAVDLYQDRLDPVTLAHRLDPNGYRIFPHLDVIADACIDAVSSPDILVVRIITPPQHSKSQTASVAVPTWLLDWFPWLNVGLASYAQNLATRNARAVRNNFAAHTDLLRTRLAPDSRRKDYWNTVDGGQLVATSVDGQLTGEPITVMILDDLIKSWGEARSPARREQIWNWILADVMGRLSDQTHTYADGTTVTVHQTIISIGTRYHVDDPNGRFEDMFGDRMLTVHLPAIADEHLAPDDPTLHNGQRQHGEALCPELHPLAELEFRRERLGERIFDTVYQGRPTEDEGGTIGRELWKIDEAGIAPEQRLATCTSWDLTFGDTGKSWVVGQCWTVTRHYERGWYRYHLVDEIRRKADFAEQRIIMRHFIEQNPDATHHLIENRANGPAILRDLRDIWIDPDTGRRYQPIEGLVAIEPVGDKVTRLLRNSPRWSDGLVHVPGYWQPKGPRYPGDTGDDPTRFFPASLIEEAASLGGQTERTDDEIDAAVHAIEWLHQRFDLYAEDDQTTAAVWRDNRLPAR